MRELSDEQLLLRYQKAEVKAFEAFYQRRKGLLFNFLRMKLGNKHDAEEAFQETFLRIHKYILKYDPNQNAMNWVFKIAKNAAIDVIAKNSKLNKLKQEITDIAAERRDSTHVALEAKQDIESLLAKLNEDERELIRSRFIDDQPYEAIAARLKLKPDGVRQRVSRLVRKIKLRLPSV